MNNIKITEMIALRATGEDDRLITFEDLRLMQATPGTVIENYGATAGFDGVTTASDLRVISVQDDGYVVEVTERRRVTDPMRRNYGESWDFKDLYRVIPV